MRGVRDVQLAAEASKKLPKPNPVCCMTEGTVMAVA